MATELALKLGHADPALEAGWLRHDTELLKDAKDAIQVAILRIDALAEATKTAHGEEGLTTCLDRLDDAGAALSLAMRKIEDEENFR